MKRINKPITLEEFKLKVEKDIRQEVTQAVENGINNLPQNYKLVNTS
jgi:hypothetical protein